MALVLIKGHLSREDITKAREDYQTYLKIAADLRQELVVIGGFYHAEAEKLLLDEYASHQDDLWGGGYDLKSGRFETNAIINIRPGKNDSPEILDPEIRNKFLKLAKEKLVNLNECL
ncbi:MAG: DUF5674 family protein [bacterium]|nr:DUF5674 family protein [bacterium]